MSVLTQSTQIPAPESPFGQLTGFGCTEKVTNSQHLCRGMTMEIGGAIEGGFVYFHAHMDESSRCGGRDIMAPCGQLKSESPKIRAKDRGETGLPA